VDARVVLLLEGGFLVDCIGLVWAVGKYMWGKSKDTELIATNQIAVVIRATKVSVICPAISLMPSPALSGAVVLGTAAPLVFFWVMPFRLASVAPLSYGPDRRDSQDPYSHVFISLHRSCAP